MQKNCLLVGRIGGFRAAKLRKTGVMLKLKEATHRWPLSVIDNYEIFFVSGRGIGTMPPGYALCFSCRGRR